MSSDTKTVSWYNCDCDWITKYCEENHKTYARIPLEVLNSYARESLDELARGWREDA